MDRPNILWICTDQQRFDTLGCYGNAFVRSPNVDRLAASGVLFERCYSQSPVCTPSRASFLTGRYPRTTRARQNGQNIPAGEILVTRLLAAAGYNCGLAGKLHLSTASPRFAPAMEARINDGYHEFHWSHHPQPSWPTNEYILWLREKGVTFDTPRRPDCQWVLQGMPAEHHQTTWCAQKAVTFIEAAAEFDRPWLFSVNPFDPHFPFDPPPEYLAPYLERLDEIPLPNYVEGELDNKPRFQQLDHAGEYGSTKGHAFLKHRPRDHRMVRAAYWAMCDLIDAQVGRMVDALARTGQLDKTIVIFTSDHGELLGDHGMYLKGPHFYDPCVHVPLIVSWPGRIAGGRRVGALVELTDLAQTLLDAAGLPHHAGMQGRSLWPMLTGAQDGGTHRDDVYCEYYNAMPWLADRAHPPHATMVRTRNHKLAVYHGLDEGELYDLAADPNETRNLWSSPAHRDVKLELMQRLCDRMAWTVDPLPVRLGQF